MAPLRSEYVSADVITTFSNNIEQKLWRIPQYTRQVDECRPRGRIFAVDLEVSCHRILSVVSDMHHGLNF